MYYMHNVVFLFNCLYRIHIVYIYVHCVGDKMLNRKMSLFKLLHSIHTSHWNDLKNLYLFTSLMLINLFKTLLMLTGQYNK